MPQARRIESFAHGDNHLKPGVGGEMCNWSPEQFGAVRKLLANCEDCQACLFKSAGEDAGHLYAEAVVAIATKQINRGLSLIVRHLRECEACANEIFNVEQTPEFEKDQELDFDNPLHLPIGKAGK